MTMPCGPLSWLTRLPAPGYLPKTNPLHGRWITASGGQAAFIKKAIEAGMLGAAEAHKITADTDHHQTGGMFLRISQNNEVCTVDASIAKFARGKRTWKSGHYFWNFVSRSTNPLVSGGNLLGRGCGQRSPARLASSRRWSPAAASASSVVLSRGAVS